MGRACQSCAILLQILSTDRGKQNFLCVYLISQISLGPISLEKITFKKLDYVELYLMWWNEHQTFLTICNIKCRWRKDFFLCALDSQISWGPIPPEQITFKLLDYADLYLMWWKEHRTIWTICNITCRRRKEKLDLQRSLGPIPLEQITSKYILLCWLVPYAVEWTPNIFDTMPDIAILTWNMLRDAKKHFSIYLSVFKAKYWFGVLGGGYHGLVSKGDEVSIDIFFT
jgi:hypothetical protein